MEMMIRTKIKGNMTIRSEDVSVPNFNNLPHLPVCYKRPSAVLDAMKNAILKLPTASGAVGHAISTMGYVSPSQQLGRVAGGIHHHQTVSPRAEAPHEVSVDGSQGQSAQFQSLPSPPLRSVSNESQAMMNPHVPAMAMNNYHSPIQVHTIGSTQPVPMHETSAQGLHHHPHMLHGSLRHDHDFCFSLRNDEDFEPLPFSYADDGDASCDDFASFIEGAIHQIGE